jgi:hypothetical protein
MTGLNEVDETGLVAMLLLERIAVATGSTSIDASAMSEIT